MAACDKIFIADKTTLDAVKTKVDGIDTKAGGKLDDPTNEAIQDGSGRSLFGLLFRLWRNIGQSSDTGGTTTAGSVSAKLNKIIDWLNTTLWNSITNIYSNANSAKVNTDVNNTASATGTLSQKLSHIIGLLGGGYKILKSYIATVSYSAAGTYTVVDVTGGGVFRMMYVNDYVTGVTVVIDGVSHTVSPGSNARYIGYRFGNANMITSGSSDTGVYGLHFKQSLKITFTANNSSSSQPVVCNYDLYE